MPSRGLLMCAVLAAAVLLGCGGGPSPRESAERFVRQLNAGEWEQACDEMWKPFEPCPEGLRDLVAGARLSVGRETEPAPDDAAAFKLLLAEEREARFYVSLHKVDGQWRPGVVLYGITTD